MEGLGYSSNRVPFTQLASLAPYEALAGAALKLPPQGRVVAIGRWLMSCSGLGEAGAPVASKRRRPKGLGRVMDRREWHLFRVRPSNHPGRRILGAAVILDRFVERGLAVGLRQEAGEMSPAGLTASLCAVSRAGPAYVGQSRGRDLAVNAVLPFLHAWEEGEADGGGAGIAQAVYERFPMLAGNEVTREMTEQLLPVGWRKAVSNARRQQGLLHLSALLRGAY